MTPEVHKLLSESSISFPRSKMSAIEFFELFQDGVKQLLEDQGHILHEDDRDEIDFVVMSIDNFLYSEPLERDTPPNIID
jgi:hypothetical protein